MDSTPNQPLLNLQTQEELIAALTEKLPTIKCPMCSQQHFVLADGYLPQILVPAVSLGPLNSTVNVPTIGIICAGCGYLAQFAIGTLGYDPNTGKRR